jgi:two-component system KDP operon response regulator KdpE
VTDRLRVLTIDDDPLIHRVMTAALDAAGYEPMAAASGADGLAIIARRPPDAVFLDLGLPDIDGMVVLAETRHRFGGPILILSARRCLADKIEAFDLGADDYVEKPFSVSELFARLRKALRMRSPRPETVETIRVGGLEIIPSTRSVRVNGVDLHLSVQEYSLVLQLASAGDRPVSHREILHAVWGASPMITVHNLRVLVHNLRHRALARANVRSLIVTERGFGYRLNTSVLGG